VQYRVYTIIDHVQPTTSCKHTRLLAWRRGMRGAGGGSRPTWERGGRGAMCYGAWCIVVNGRRAGASRASGCEGSVRRVVALSWWFSPAGRRHHPLHTPQALPRSVCVLQREASSWTGGIERIGGFPGTRRVSLATECCVICEWRILPITQRRPCTRDTVSCTPHGFVSPRVPSAVTLPMPVTSPTGARCASRPASALSPDTPPTPTAIPPCI